MLYWKWRKGGVTGYSLFCPAYAGVPQDSPDRITQDVYNAAGERVQVREGVGTLDEAAEATWAYNLNGQVTTVIDGNGNRAGPFYDGHGRQNCWMFPSTTRPPSYNDATQASALASAGAPGGTIVDGRCATGDFEAYEYDLGGNRILLRKRDTSTLTYAYDALNRLTSKVPVRHGTIPLNGVHQRSVHYAYDLRNLQTAARFESLGGEGITNAYDGFGRLASSSTSMGGVTRTLTYQYDPNGNRTRITHPGDTVFFFRTDYDGLNRPTWLWANGVTGMAYQGYYAQGGLAGRSLANGANSQWGYDAVQRLGLIIHNPAGTARDATWTFGYNPAGQIASQARDNNAYAWTRHYAVARAYTTNGLNQYSATASTTSSGPVSTTYTYDRNGNLVATDNLFEVPREYAYDVENRLVERSGGVVLTYDPLGRLFRVANGTAKTTFLYDGDALVAEYNSAGEMSRRYVHNVGADVPLLSYEGATLGLPSYLHADHQGSIVAVSDPWGAGSVNTYDEYGIPGVANVGRFQYTGQIWLPELGMYHYKARVYSPTLGRFLQTDPVGYADQFNLYVYVGNDPVNRTDPTGTTCREGRNGTFCRIDRIHIGGIRELPVSRENLTPHYRARVLQFEARYTRAYIAMRDSDRTVTVGATGGRPDTSFRVSTHEVARSLAARQVAYNIGVEKGNALLDTYGNPNAAGGSSAVLMRVFERGINSSVADIVHDGIHSTLAEYSGNGLAPVLGERPYNDEHQDPYNRAARQLLGLER